MIELSVNPFSPSIVATIQRDSEVLFFIKNVLS